MRCLSSFKFPGALASSIRLWVAAALWAPGTGRNPPQVLLDVSTCLSLGAISDLCIRSSRSEMSACLMMYTIFTTGSIVGVYHCSPRSITPMPLHAKHGPSSSAQRARATFP